MPKFNIQSNQGLILQVSFEERNIRSVGGQLFPCLEIPVEILPRLPANDSIQSLTIVGTLLWGRNRTTRIGDLKTALLYRANWTQGELVQHTFQIPLSYFQIHGIESLRQLGKPEFAVNLQCLVHGTRPQGPWQDVGEGWVDFVIARDDWIEKVLDSTGYDSLTLLQLPSLDKGGLASRWPDAARELKKAEENLRKDWGQAVEDCRKALQPIVDTCKQEEKDGDLTPRLKAFMKNHLAGSLGDKFSENIANRVHELWTISSKEHHRSYTYSRSAAVFMVNSTATMLALISEHFDKQG